MEAMYILVLSLNDSFQNIKHALVINFQMVINIYSLCQLMQDIELILRRFASNIIFSNGLRDPYSSGG